MKDYIIKDTIIDLRGKQAALVYFTGKDEYVHECGAHCKGYKTRAAAIKKIYRVDIDYLNNKELSSPVLDSAYIWSVENDIWLHKYEIIERELN